MGSAGSAGWVVAMKDITELYFQFANDGSLVVNISHRRTGVWGPRAGPVVSVVLVYYASV